MPLQFCSSHTHTHTPTHLGGPGARPCPGGPCAHPEAQQMPPCTPAWLQGWRQAAQTESRPSELVDVALPRRCWSRPGLHGHHRHLQPPVAAVTC
eukprot:scaffold73690_cov18-Tisochrysis_lutea.AAC.1